MNIKKIQKSDVNLDLYKKQKNIRRIPKSLNIDFENVIFSTDQDLDGFHIRGILLSFFVKYCPNLIQKKKIHILNTPLIVLKQKNKIITYFYTFQEYNKFIEGNKDKFEIQYKKGLGSWTPEELAELVEEAGGIEKFLKPFEWEQDTIKNITQWFDDAESDSRKEKILNNNFDIMKA